MTATTVPSLPERTSVECAANTATQSAGPTFNDSIRIIAQEDSGAIGYTFGCCAFSNDVTIVSGAIVLAGAAHLVEIFIWAMVFVLCGQFGQLSAAFYTSAMLYTTLGTGEVAMSSSWKLLGPFETADGMLAFGVSTAIVISVGQLIVRKKFSDLPNF